MKTNVSSRQANRSEALLNGPVAPTLLSFALPVILGNIFQQLYNIVDAIVVGKFLGDVPLGGISIASPMMDILYALLLGGSIGVSVLVGQLCGAGQWDRLRRVHATALTGGVGITLLLALAGLLSARPVLLAQGSSPETVDQAMHYLYIILGGLVFCFLYNYFAAVLRSWGDSRTPFVVLLVSSTLHAGLDVLLCGVFRFGIRGVACSTVFCQVFSTVWLVLYTEKRCPALRLTRQDLRPDPTLGKMILGYAWAAALQQAVVMIGRFLVQGMLTPLGDASLTGYNMGMRVEQFLFCFSQGISAAMVVGLSQNLGRGNLQRVRRFFLTGLCVEAALVAVMSTPVHFLAPRLIHLFSDSPSIIAAGVQYTGTMAYLYLFAYLGEAIQGFFRGIGRLRLTMLASILQVVLRVILSYFLVPLFGIRGICASVATGWILLVFIEGSYSLRAANSMSRAAGPDRQD
ncbi:MATE family efflux transporter [Dysosmobacter sp.]|uniref:MATE family efflux transporter n=1 Tax=Dysosmobacter sp. TaxID=2591382 RepID=UPI002A848382|nr:MATE family efflux transporter [Dysosmobacter sp.]MDY3281368.1 MATE family efflux transporter [Dysosmobacter sp.]